MSSLFTLVNLTRQNEKSKRVSRDFSGDQKRRQKSFSLVDLSITVTHSCIGVNLRQKSTFCNKCVALPGGSPAVHHSSKLYNCNSLWSLAAVSCKRYLVLYLGVLIGRLHIRCTINNLRRR